MLYIVVPQFNQRNHFNEFILQLNAQTFRDYQLVIVDHGTERIDYKADNAYTVLGSPDGWYCYAVNRGILYVMNDLHAKDSDHILLINTDVTIDENYLENVMYSIKQKPEAAIGSCCYDKRSETILYINLKLDKLHAKFRYLNTGIELKEVKKEFYPSDLLKGLGTVWPVDMLKSIGLYNEKKLPHYRGDHELPWRAKKKGYEIYVSGYMKVGAILDSPNPLLASDSFWRNYRNRFIEIRSTRKISDLWNFAFICFGRFYGFYFFLFNFLRDQIYFIYEYNRLKHPKTET